MTADVPGDARDATSTPAGAPTRVRPGALGNDGGIIGAALWTQELADGVR